jgi:hypothetical protein
LQSIVIVQGIVVLSGAKATGAVPGIPVIIDPDAQLAFLAPASIIAYFRKGIYGGQAIVVQQDMHSTI